MIEQPKQMPYKDPAEVVDVTFDFTNEMTVTETISSAQQSVTVRYGTDAAPSALLDGAASIVNKTVLQRITGGTSGVAYILRSVASLSSGRKLVRAGVLPVRTLQ